MSNNKVEVIFCDIFPPTLDHLQYMCYGREVCCENGCCIDGPRHFYQTWYYWCLLLIALGLASASSWLCKKPSSGPHVRSDAFSQLNSYNYQHILCNREYRHNFQSPRNFEERNDNIILDQLFASFKNKKLSGNNPPSYNSIFEMEQKPSTSVHKGCDSPPSYTSTSKENPKQKFCEDKKHQIKNIDDPIVHFREE